MMLWSSKRRHTERYFGDTSSLSLLIVKGRETIIGKDTLRSNVAPVRLANQLKALLTGFSLIRNKI